MENEKKGVKPEEAETSPKPEEEKQSAEASEGVKTPEDVVSRKVYEKVREAMKTEREAKKEKQSQVVELEERIANLEQGEEVEEDTDYDPYKAKTDILFLMNKDPFVKENLDLIEEKMASNPKLNVRAATREIKAEFFDRIQKETSSQTPQKETLIKQEKPTADEEERKPETTGDAFKDALAGKTEVDPRQLEAIKRQLPRQE